MKRNQLIVISFILTLFGIVALFFLKPDVSPQLLQMDALITNVYEKEKVTFLTVIPKNFTVVSFEKFEIEKGNATLIGRLQQYKGRVEFVVTELRQSKAVNKQ